MSVVEEDEDDEELDGVVGVVFVAVAVGLLLELVDDGFVALLVVVVELLDDEVGPAGGVELEASDDGSGMLGCGARGAAAAATFGPGVEGSEVVAFRSGRWRSRFATEVWADRAASAPAAAAAPAWFEPCEAVSVLFRSESWCWPSATATPPLTASTLVTAAAVLTLPLAPLILPGRAWLATCLPEPDMPDKGGLPPSFASWARGVGCSVFERPREACRE